jgi:hypothetical protein
MDSPKAPSDPIWDPLNISGRRPDSKWAAVLDLLGWLNPVTLVTLIATGMAKLLGRLFDKGRG